jgi:hypothetical protein
MYAVPLPIFCVNLRVKEECFETAFDGVYAFLTRRSVVIATCFPSYLCHVPTTQLLADSGPSSSALSDLNKARWFSQWVLPFGVVAFQKLGFNEGEYLRN